MKNLLFLIMTCCATLALAAAVKPSEPSGASAAFTSSDPIVKKALKLMDSGKFKEAEALLAKRPGKADPQAVEELKDIMQRIRYEYALTPEGLTAKVQKSIPNATAAEVERWATETRARFRMIDGQKFYFRREPQNIFLYSEAAQQRRKEAGNAPSEEPWKLTDHLAAIVKAAEESGESQVVPVTHKVVHSVTIRANHPAIKKGSVVRVWLPFPQEYRQQQSVKLISTSPEKRVVAPNAIEGNPIGGGAQRSVYFEQTVEDPSQPLEFKEEFSYVSYAYYPKLDPALVQPLPANWNGACLSERPPHIVFTPELRNLVSKLIGKEKNPLVNARTIFHWVSANIPWNAEDEYCIIPSFVKKGLAARRGDCGIQNTVFVTMCRYAGIPARWQSGFETKPGKWGMHDWAEIYIAPWGWLPADASYGVQQSSDPRVADFYLGHQDSYRMIVNLDWGRDFIPAKTSFRSEPADFQRGEVEVDGRNLYFSEWEYDTSLER
jgi:transglutaminase-like putative cysteine protease